MNLRLEVPQIGIQADVDEIRSFLEEEIGTDLVVADGLLKSANDEEILSQTDMFTLGVQFGRQKEKAFWEKPDVFFLPNDKAKALEIAIELYEEEAGINVDSIEIGFPKENITEISVGPTQAVHLFNIAVRYKETLMKR